MKNSKEIIENVKKRGYVLIDSVYFPPNSPRALQFIAETTRSTKKNKVVLKGLKSGSIDDYRNLRNKENQTDMFMKLINQVLGVEVWPEFYFSTERDYRFDYAIPVNTNLLSLKIAIEVEGGIWLKGKSGHSSGTGIQRDMDKSSLANVMGWTLIRRTPDQLMTNETIELIRKAIELKIK